ncbi:lipopolysaccharide biosynthesis protein [[Collinsella] massiliensis]|uniref:lipopolysaccharide biosynthesis protein n=1 Tax=[Collinsella] massiliensis TaxID=1232426 RepID=UPI00117CFA87|nr:oligosaccharide flippase family protein [[Collinsella] massiliensis]
MNEHTENNAGSTETSRTVFAAKNSFYGLIGKAAGLIVSFVSRTIFIYALGQYYLGVNGLYTDILNMLSFAELGFGSAMTFALYGPVARNEERRVGELLSFYKKTYRIIALVITVLGIGLVPFLQYIIRGADSLSLFELRLYFLIFLANTVVTYFVSYKYGLLNAMQRTYLQTNLETLTTVTSAAIQIVALLLTSSFLVYLLSNTITLIISRVLIARYLNRKYPLLTRYPNASLPRAERKKIIHEVQGLAVHQFASVAVYATDSIIISAIPTLGIAVVGAVSNYNMIINAISGIVIVVLNGAVAGFGNLAISSSKKRFLDVFKEANFIDFWIYGVCTVSLFVLLPPFIELWIGENYLIDRASFLLILVNFYLQGQSTIYNNARIAKGNFNMDKNWALAQALTNLVVSTICALHFGLVGVYMGTVASRLVLFISRPCVTYRFLFDEGPIRYFITSAKYFIAVSIAAGLCFYSCEIVIGMLSLTWLSFMLAIAICVIEANLFFYIVFSKNQEFSEFKIRLQRLIGRVKR